MEVLYISVLASNKAIDEASQRDPGFCSYAVHKFHRLVANGFVRNGSKVIALSTFHQNKFGIGQWRLNENENGVCYRYIPSFHFRPFRMVWLMVYCFFFVFIWGIKNKKKKVLVCDVLNISSCIGAVAAARIIGLRRAGIMTDMPGMMVSREVDGNNFVKSQPLWYARINKSFLSHFTHYVFLTEQMNGAINTKNRPYIVMEGLVDSDMAMPEGIEKSGKRIVLYAGGLHERYGLKMLVEGFIQANVEDSELWLYGSGPFAEEIPSYHSKDSRIIYKGIRPNNEVVEAELQATLLVNPRPTHEEFTKYSFPSKNLEYMVSGTPVLTTLLPGMPEEYFSHVYLFDHGETADGYASVLRYVLSLPQQDLINKGIEAREWVLCNKNHIKQAERIIQLLG